MKPKQKISMEPMFPVNGKFVMLSALLIGILVATTQAQDQKAVKPSAAAPASPTSLGSRDAIYIDDDTIEGSGGRGGIHEDLEKDPDYSGSGFGPDDEDAEPDQHSHTSHNTRVSQNIGGGINTAHLPPQTSSTTSTTTTVPTTTTKTPSTSSTTTTTATPTIAASTTTSTTATPSQVNSTIPATSTNQPIFPAFDKDLDLAAGSGDKIDDDDEEDDDIFGAPIDEEIEKDGDIDIDRPISQTPVLSGKPKDDNDNDNDYGNGDSDDGDDDGTIDVDGGNEEEDENVNGGGTGRTSTGGNDGDIITERGPGAGDTNVHGLDPNTNVNSQPSDTKSSDHRPNGNEVVIMSEDDRTSSFFSQPGILAAVIGGAVVGLLCAILVVMFIVYRMRKKDEGSYALDEPKRSPANNSYAKNANNREFYA
ncbi:syndecan isoform X2 [Drosophila kikkawai]|uniref:Syndecan n=1 Tax=Drosophila kikkawai TaxID=30033 RepID=A0A6P4II97_DROKI|nr:syndecan isoform X2 [Drosophila kikkawai]